MVTYWGGQLAASRPFNLSSPAELAVGETVILLHPPLHLAGTSIVFERGRQQSDGLTDGLAVGETGVLLHPP